MSKKNNQIISILARNKEIITSNELSELMGVSSRTVKRIIWDVDTLLQKNGARILSGKSGYQLEVEDQGLFGMFMAEQKRLSKDLKINEEVVYHIMELLFVREYVTQDELSFELYISRSTINKHIKHIKKLLEKEKIILSNRPHYGYYLIGQEAEIRNYMVKLFFMNNDLRNMNDNLLVKNCRDYDQFYNEAIKMLFEYGYDENNSKTQSLIKYFIVLATRFYHHHPIDKYNDDLIISIASRELALGIKQLLDDFFYVNVTEDEIVYLTYLMGNPVKRMVELKHYDPSFFEDVVDDFFVEIKGVYQQDFSYDETLRKGLIQHLYTSYSRMYINALINNPILNMIKTQYVEAYNYAIACGSILAQKYQLELNEDSLGYISMHFAAAIERNDALYKFKAVVVCESGFGMAELLKTRLKNHVTNIHIVAVTSAKNLTKMDLDDIVLIISSVPVPPQIKNPVVVINPLLLEKDIENINEYLSYYRNLSEYKKIFKAELFYPNVKASSKAELLEQMCDDLIARGYLDKSNKNDIFHREAISSTEINDLVAIPHCILESNYKTFFAIATLNSEIDWGRGKAQLVFLGAIARSGNVNKKVFPLIYKLTMDQEKVAHLCTITEFEIFITELFKNLPFEYE